jgi:hypothetical protein
MTWERGIWTWALVTCAGLGIRPALAVAGPCYDFVTPAFTESLDPAKVKRIFVAVEGSAASAREVVEDLAQQIRGRGITPVLDPGGTGRGGDSAERAAKRICRERDTQLVATVRLLTGTTPAATVDFITPTGQVIGRVTAWRDSNPACGLVASTSGPAAVPAATKQSWYGYQLMIADAVSLAAVLTWTPFSAAGALLYLVAPVAMHGSNGQGIMAAASLGLRLILPFMGMLVVASVDSCTSDVCTGGMVAGLGLGMLAAALVDDLGLAWKPVREGENTPTVEPVSPARDAYVSLSATVIPYRGGAGLGLMGRF